MTLKDMVPIYDEIVTNYPRMFKDIPTETQAKQCELWAEYLADFQPAEVRAAVRSYLLEDHDFPPSVGKLCQICMANRKPVSMRMTEDQALALVNKALKNSLYHSEEEYNRLPRIIQELVVSPSNLYNIALNEMDDRTVWEASFLRSFRAKSEAYAREEMLPDSVRLGIAKVRERISGTYEPSMLQMPSQPVQAPYKRLTVTVDTNTTPNGKGAEMFAQKLAEVFAKFDTQTDDDIRKHDAESKAKLEEQAAKLGKGAR